MDPKEGITVWTPLNATIAKTHESQNLETVYESVPLNPIMSIARMTRDRTRFANVSARFLTPKLPATAACSNRAISATASTISAAPITASTAWSSCESIILAYARMIPGIATRQVKTMPINTMARPRLTVSALRAARRQPSLSKNRDSETMSLKLTVTFPYSASDDQRTVITEIANETTFITNADASDSLNASPSDISSSSKQQGWKRAKNKYSNV